MKEGDDKMKKRIIIPIGIILILGIITIICLSIIRNRNNEIEEPIIRDKKFLNAGNRIDEEYEEKNKVFTNYEEYKEVFNSDEITEKDFEENNYVLIDIKYDPCRDKNLIPISHTINENNIDVVISYEAGCGVCPQDHEYYLLKVFWQMEFQILDRNTVSILLDKLKLEIMIF